jgi:hypothetical protein
MKNVLLAIPLFLLANVLVYADTTGPEGEVGLTEMLAMNEQTCLWLGIPCDQLKERTVNIWTNLEIPRSEGIDDLLKNWIVSYKSLDSNSDLVQVLHDNVKSICGKIDKHPKVATFSPSQREKALTFCESGIYNKISQLLWPGWFSHSPLISWFNQNSPFLKANFNLGNLIKTQAGETPAVCPWDCEYGYCVW